MNLEPIHVYLPGAGDDPREALEVVDTLIAEFA